MSEQNRMRLLWAGFMAILAAGVGFAVRGGIFDNWSTEFGFTAAELGAVAGGGFTGFCFGIIIGGVLCDKIGYGKLVVAALVLHVVSALVTIAPTASMGKETVFAYLLWGMFIFAFANGVLEAVANPLVATLFPENRTHYLNLLHASWPAGLVLGAAAGWILDDKFAVNWRYQLALYLIPTVAYGLMFMGQHFPKSEASRKGLKLGEMLKDVGVLGALAVCYLLALFFNGPLGLDKPTAYTLSVLLLIIVGFLTREQTQVSSESLGALAICILLAAYFQQALRLPESSTLAIGGALLIGLGSVFRFSVGSVLLFVLFIVHALVGAVELGTDGWIQNITGNLLTSEQGKILFVFTSATMFALRFCANFIEKQIGLSPIAILLTSAVLACVGLNLTSGITSFGGALLALTVYGIGKTFFWPTMLAVASDRFPRTGAVAISIMGGIGMLSAGLIGSPGLGYAKDRFAGEALQKSDSKLYDEYKADKPSKFLVFADATGLDGFKLGAIQGKLKDAQGVVAKGKVEDLKQDELAKLTPEKRKEAEGQHVKLKEIEATLKAASVLKEGGSKDTSAAIAALTPSEKKIHEASIAGDRKTLQADSAIPALMALIYLGLLLYFRSIGGYKPVQIEEKK